MVTLDGEGVQAELQMYVMIVKSTGKGADFFEDDLVSLDRRNGDDESQTEREEYLAAKVAACSGGAMSSAYARWGRRRGCCWAAVLLVLTLGSG